MPIVSPPIWLLAVAALGAPSALYLVAALCSVISFARRGTASGTGPGVGPGIGPGVGPRVERRLGTGIGAAPEIPITVLKPVCGLDAELMANLRSFCDQDYGAFQIVFGLRDADDPARRVVERLIADYPERDLVLVVDGRARGANHKASNLANMMRAAKHELLLVADADVRIGRRFLETVAACFADPRVGAASAPYAGVAAGGLPSQLGAMFVNDWFLPSVLVSGAAQDMDYCLGAAMAVRRDLLERIGGFEALEPYLADDFMLGQLIRAEGAEVRLLPSLVETVVHEPSIRALLVHELRWARTIRSVQPVGYALSFVTDALPIAVLLGLLVYALTGSLAYPAAGIALVLVLRLLLHYAVRASLGLRQPAMPWLVPLRDTLTFAVRAASFAGQSVSWRGRELSVAAGSRLSLRSDESHDEVAVPKPPVV